MEIIQIPPLPPVIIFFNIDSRLTFYPKSIYYQNDTAQWVPVDSQLIPTTQAPFVVKNKANRFDAFFGDEGEFRFQEQEKFLDIWPMNPFPSVGSVTGNKITYHNIYPNADIQFTSENDGVKEQIILQKPSAPYTFIIGTNTQGLQLKKDDKSGSLTVVDNKENAIAHFTDPVMTDAQNKSIGQLTLETQNSDGKTQLVISIDPKSLRDSSVHYPIEINLTLAKNGEDLDLLNSNDYPAIDSNIPGQSFTQYVLTNVQSGLSYTSLSASLFQFADKLLQQEKPIDQDINVDETSLMSAWNLANRINDGEANINHQSSLMLQPLPVEVSNDPIPAIYRRDNSNGSHTTTNTMEKWGKSLNYIGTYLQPLGDGTMLLVDGDGNKSIFKRNIDGTFSPSMGVYSHITKNAQNNLFTAVRIDGSKLSFNLSGKITSITNSDGSTLDYTYNQYGRLTQISNKADKTVSFIYDANGYLSKVTGLEDLSYLYDTKGNPSLIIDETKNVAMGIHYPDEMIPPQKQESRFLGVDENHTTEQPNQGNILQGKNNWKWVTPSERVTSPFGPRDKEFHKGLDIGAIQRGVDGDPVWTMADGIVEYAGLATGYGNVIYLRHPDGIQTRYGHLSSIDVKTGQIVQQGELIGTMGHSGEADGTHLHFEIRQNDQPLNPELFFQLPGRSMMVKG